MKDKYAPLFEKVLTGNPIPEKWMWNKNGRTHNPFEKELDCFNNEDIENIPCPCCGQKSLEIKESDLYWETREYWVGCNNCDWDLPGIPRNTDYGEIISEFTEWLAVFNMLGRPKELLNSDITLFYYPEGEKRNKAIEFRIHEEEHKYDE